MDKKVILLTIIALLLTFLAPPDAGVSQPERPNEAQITAFLNKHPLIIESGAAVLGVTIQAEGLVIDLSEAVLPTGSYDEAVFTRLQADLDQALNINHFYMTTFKIEGKPLEFWGRPLPDFDRQIESPSIQQTPADGPLSGVKIALSPGHGLYWHETYATWLYQRAEFFGIREDTVNAEIMRYVQTALINQGATVIQLRELDFYARTGVTGYPAWHEAARQYAIAEGLPSWIYDGSNTNYNSDIRARPYMANYYNADLFISLHNNGWDSTLRGTETYWDVNKHPGSQAFANAVHGNIIQTIRQEYDPAWIDRNVKSSDWRYGEIYYAEMPAILIELAFMDNPIDNSYLHDETFKMLAAKAITRGVCQYWGVTCDDISVIHPQVIEIPSLEPPYGNGMCDSGWYRFTNERGQYAYLALNAASEDQSSHQAVWKHQPAVSGSYRLEAFIPDHSAINWLCPDKTINWDTSQAAYQIVHADGTSVIQIDQAPIANQWVDLGIYHLDHQSETFVTLSDVTGEAFQSTTISVSAIRFTLVGEGGLPIYNTDWVSSNWLIDEANVPVSAIRDFFAKHNSCLKNPILDVDATQIDIPTLIQEASTAYQINPKLLLALMEAEQNAISQCPDATALASLMGIEPPSTARAQIASEAARIANTLDSLIQNGHTPNGWSTGISKVTFDGVGVIPANTTITVLFDYQQNAGVAWGGFIPGEKGVQSIYAAWQAYNLGKPLEITEIKNFLPLVLN